MLPCALGPTSNQLLSYRHRPFPRRHEPIVKRIADANRKCPACLAPSESSRRECAFQLLQAKQSHPAVLVSDELEPARNARAAKTSISLMKKRRGV